jgi:hypothetical protein
MRPSLRDILPPIYEPRALTQADIEAARAMSFEEKFLAGGRLYDEWESRCKAILRARYPDATPSDILGMIGRHIEEERAREYVGFVPSPDDPPPV